MVRLFSRNKGHVVAPPLPVAVAETLRMFSKVWPLPVQLLAYMPGAENIHVWEEPSHAEFGGLLMMTDDLIVYSCWETVDTVPWVTPLARVTGVHFFQEEQILWVRCGHPTERGEYLDTYWYLPTKPNGPEDPFALKLRNTFLEQLIPRIPRPAPTEEELWPAAGELGVGAGWVGAVVDQASTGPYPPLAHWLGDHRRVSRIPDDYLEPSVRVQLRQLLIDEAVREFQMNDHKATASE